MSDTNLLALPTRITATPRVQRGAAAVIAQYIQDLTHPDQAAGLAQPDLCAAAA